MNADGLSAISSSLSFAFNKASLASSAEKPEPSSTAWDLSAATDISDLIGDILIEFRGKQIQAVSPTTYEYDKWDDRSLFASFPVRQP
jgi:hypothetical protein